MAPWLLLLVGCAAGGDPGDGGSNLPERGFAGYERLLDADEAPVEPIARPEGATLGDPYARVVDGRVELYVARCPDDAPCHIAVARSDDGLSFGPLEVFAEDADGLTAPFVFDETLYAVRGDGAAIVAVAGGAPTTLLDGGDARLGSPSVVDADGPWAWLYLTRETDAAHEVLRMQLGPGPGTLEPVELPGLPEVWTPPAILQPEVRRATTGAGRAVYRMVYAGRPGGGDADLAFAASFDGRVFSDWPFDPALGGDPDEFAPSNIRLGDRYLLYYARAEGRLGVAERRADNPTESF